MIMMIVIEILYVGRVYDLNMKLDAAIMDITREREKSISLEEELITVKER